MEYKTKEQIWQEQENNPALSFSESALIAMEEYGTQQAIVFAEWLRQNFKNITADYWNCCYKSIMDKYNIDDSNYTTQQLYTLFTTQSN